MNNEPTIKILHLSKTYGKIRAVEDLNLTIHRGEVFGFLGPNGAGKTTTIRMMVGLIRPTTGSVEICGHDVFRSFMPAISKMGVMVEAPTFYPYLSGRKNLEILYRLSLGSKLASDHHEQIDKALETVQLTDRGHDPVKQYSQGMKQRLGIAAAILHRPECVILDEPTNGLDPAGRKEMRSLIRSLVADRHITVFLSSHLLSEVEQICNRIAIIDKGKLLACDSVKSILQQTNESLENFFLRLTESE